MTLASLARSQKLPGIVSAAHKSLDIDECQTYGRSATPLHVLIILDRMTVSALVLKACNIPSRSVKEQSDPMRRLHQWLLRGFPLNIQA